MVTAGTREAAQISAVTAADTGGIETGSAAGHSLSGKRKAPGVFLSTANREWREPLSLKDLSRLPH